MHLSFSFAVCGGWPWAAHMRETKARSSMNQISVSSALALLHTRHEPTLATALSPNQIRERSYHTLSHNEKKARRPDRSGKLIAAVHGYSTPPAAGCLAAIHRESL